jgi:lipopolysaccharide export system ATP-binding protein
MKEGDPRSEELKPKPPEKRREPRAASKPPSARAAIARVAARAPAPRPAAPKEEPPGGAAERPRKAAGAQEAIAGASSPLEAGRQDPGAPQAAFAPQTAVLESEPPALLEVEGLTKSYGGRQVVQGVSFTVNSGEVIGLLGKNGAGKTTTFRMTIGMIVPDEGSIRFGGADVTRLPMYRRARLGMGYLSQEPSVFRGLTVEQNLSAILELTPLSARERVRRRDDLVEEFGLGRLLHSKAAVLSGGEKRRLEIARALITEPRLILLDEPFSGVDPIAVSEIQQIILRLKERGIGILLTDHNVRETLNTTDRSFIILDGSIIAQGSRDDILSNPTARKYYLGERFQM